jgi:small GTP-binding protein
MTKGKVVFVGDATVGKTAIIRKFKHGDFSQAAPTIGANSLRCSVEIRVDKTVTLNVWDTAGQDDFKCLLPMFLRGAEVAVICFDVSSRITFDHLTEWTSFFNGEIQSCRLLIACNKIDLDPAVEPSEVEDFCQTLGVYHYRTSAKTGDGVDVLFRAIADVVDANETAAERQAPTIELTGAPGPDKPCC